MTFMARPREYLHVIEGRRRAGDHVVTLMNRSISRTGTRWSVRWFRDE